MQLALLVLVHTLETQHFLARLKGKHYLLEVLVRSDPIEHLPALPLLHLVANVHLLKSTIGISHELTH